MSNLRLRMVLLPILVIGLALATISLKCQCAYADPGAVYLTEIPSVSGVNGHVRSNLQMFGVPYSRCLESLDFNNDWEQAANSNFIFYNWQWRSVYNLQGQYSRLTGACGILDNSRTDRIDSFEIDGDGNVLFSSPVMHVGNQPAKFDLNISGVSDLELVVTSGNHAGKGGKDCAVWGNLKVYPGEPIAAAPPQDDNPAPPQDDNPAPPQGAVYNWTDVPQDQDVTLSHAEFDESGYQLSDTQGDTIVVPYTDSTGFRNLYVMKFARSADSQFHFINEGNAPILYVPDGGYLDNGTAPGARWYPFTDSFYPNDPVYMGVAPDWDSYVEMGWYPGMCFYGGYYSYHPYHYGVVFYALPATIIVIGSERYHGWGGYHSYYMYHHAPYRMGYWHHNNYVYARHFHSDRPEFDRQHQFARWTGPRDARVNERRIGSRPVGDVFTNKRDVPQPQSWGRPGGNNNWNNQIFGGSRTNNPQPQSWGRPRGNNNGNNQIFGGSHTNTGFNQPTRQNIQQSRPQPSNGNNNKSSGGKNDKKR